jgi:hypothetical protein
MKKILALTISLVGFVAFVFANPNFSRTTNYPIEKKMVTSDPMGYIVFEMQVIEYLDDNETEINLSVSSDILERGYFGEYNTIEQGECEMLAKALSQMIEAAKTTPERNVAYRYKTNRGIWITLRYEAGKWHAFFKVQKDLITIPVGTLSTLHEVVTMTQDFKVE